MSRSVGREIEGSVANYLKQQGLNLITCNYQNDTGEIDLIMKDKDTLVFIEVRYRKQDDYGDGVATVTKSKQNKIKRTAVYYLIENNLYDKIACRFDVVAVSGSAYQFNWIKDAFWDNW